MTARGPDLNPILDRKVTCPACQSAGAGGRPGCELCGGTMLVRQGTRDRYLIEQTMKGRIRPQQPDGPDRYDVP